MEIVKIVCGKTGQNEDTVQKCIDCYIETIMDRMCSGYNVGVRHLGTLRIEDVAEKSAFDFKTKSNVIRPRRKLPKMSFSRDFSNKIKMSK